MQTPGNRIQISASLITLGLISLFIAVAFVPAAHAISGNGKIAFASDRDGNYEIYVMDADGSNQTRLTNNPGFDVESAWSPDGTKIVLRSSPDAPSSGHLYWFIPESKYN